MVQSGRITLLGSKLIPQAPRRRTLLDAHGARIVADLSKIPFLEEGSGVVERQQIRLLRRKQYVIQNVSLLIVLVVTGCLEFFLQSPRTFSIVVGITYVCLNLLNRIIGKGSYGLYVTLFPSMESLVQYEKEKLGIEGEKIKQRNALFTLLPVVVLFGQALVGPSLKFRLSDKVFLRFYIPFMLMLIIVINIGSYLHVRKVDNEEQGELIGYADKVLTYGIVGGIILAGIAFILAILAVL